MADTEIKRVEALIGAVKARIKAINEELLPLRNNRNRTDEQKKKSDDLDEEKKQLNAILKSLNRLLASLIDDSPEIRNILDEIVDALDQAKTSAAAIGKLPGQVKDGAGKAAQVAGAIPKALDSIDAALKFIEEELKP